MRFMLVFFILINLIAATAWGYSTDIKLIPSNFTDLPGWQQDKHSKAFESFKLSCREIIKRPLQTSSVKVLPSQVGFDSNWQSVCHAALKINALTNSEAKAFFEKWFTPYAMTNTSGETSGLFTGYYLPLLKASLVKTSHYTIPIYGLPRDIVKVDLGKFPINLDGKSIAGRVQNGYLVPYYDRAAIVSGSIRNKAPVIAWTDNWIDLFFAQIQGSAVLEFPSTTSRGISLGSRPPHLALIGYDGSNGHPYTSIAKVLIQTKQMEQQSVSMDSLRHWLAAHPKELHNVLNTDASYVFFKLLGSNAPLGTEQIPLTANRSLAVDSTYFILGMPIWLNTTLPTTDHRNAPFQHLMISQDTGGAIKGVVRGDIYFGAGKEAVWLAGNMKNQGRIWVLLPK